jgi:hypothetical protein
MEHLGSEGRFLETILKAEPGAASPSLGSFRRCGRPETCFTFPAEKCRDGAPRGETSP